MASPLEDDVGQILWIGFEGPGTPAWVLDEVAAGRVGAVILFARNIPMTTDTAAGELVDVAALMAQCRALHEAAGAPPLWIAVDQEGGRVQRVRAPATVWPPMLSFDRMDDGEAEILAAQVGQAMGHELALLGFDLDFAPVLDVHTNPANPVIGDRAFATGPERASARALAFARGLRQAGVIACGKHFPGHGDTSTDSHLALPRLDHDLARLTAVELLPFARAVAAGVPLIMTAHVVFAALDEGVPATLSRRVITGLLREEMKFSGLIVSDDLDMRAIADHMGVGEAAVRAVAAGCDALLLCRDADHQQEAREALLAAGRGRELGARIAESAARIRAAKAEHAARAGRGHPGDAGRGHPGDELERFHAAVAAHAPLAQRLRQRAAPA